MSGGFFRGTTADQDTRFSNKQAKLMKSQKFAPELENLIDMTKVKMDVMRPWIAHRVTELLGFEDEVLINFIYGLLEEKVVNGKKIQITLTGFMEKNTGKFMKELWTHLLSAQKNASGVPQEFLDAKAEEAMKKKVETDRIASEIQRKKEKEGQELEQERMKKMGGVDGVSRAKNAASEPSTRHETKDSRGDEKDLMERNGSRGRSSGKRRSRSTSVSPQPGRRSVSSGKIHRSPSRRSVTPQQSLSPPRLESSQFRRRSVSRSRLRSPSPITHMKKSPMQRRSRSPMRHRSRSPVRRRSRSPMRRRSRTPVRRRSRSPMRRRSRSLMRRRSRSPMRRRSRSPMRRRSRSPIRRRSRSPVRRVSRSPIRRRSRSPIRRRSRPPVRPRSRSPGYRFVSRSPLRRRSRSPLQRRSRSPTRPMTPSPEQRGSQSPSRGSSLSPGPGRSPSPVRRQLSSPVRPPVRGRSPPPPIRRYRRAPSTPRRRSPSPLRRRASNGGRQGSPSPRRRSLSPQERTSLSPIHRAPGRRSPLRSPRDNLRTIKKYSPVRRATLREKTEHTVESGKGSGSSERRPVSERSPQRDIKDRNNLRKKAPALSPSAFKSPYYSESPAAARSTVVDRRSSSPESPAEQMRDAAILVDSASLTMRKDKPIRESLPSSVKHEEVSFAREEDKKPKSSAKIKMHSVVADERTNSVENTRYKKEPSPERLADHRSGEVRIRTDYAELKKKDQKPKSENNAGRVPYDAKGHDGLNELENVSKLPRKIGGNGRSGSVDSGSEESDDQRVEVKEKRKHKRSRKKDVTSDDDDSYDSHVEERKEAKRRQKEEKKLKKEERRRRRAERRRRKDDRHSKKQKGNSGGNISPPSDFENNHDGSASEGDRVARKKSRVMDREEEISEQKRLEIELREKALESLRAKKGVGH